MAYKPKYFSEGEFRACTPACTLADMDGAFMARLDTLRELSGIPLVLTSAYRSREYEKAHGRSGTSAHCQGRAVDIRCRTSNNRYKIVRAAFALGFRRVGIGPSFIHIDEATDHAQDVLWDYYGG